MSKYHARKTVIDNITFDSALEAQRYVQLKLLQQSGLIDWLELQPAYELQPGFRDRDGNAVRAIFYKPDFRYIENDRVIIEEVKGVKTPLWRLKRKMFLYKYPGLELRVLTKDDI